MSVFEHHEYPGMFRYGEVLDLDTVFGDADADGDDDTVALPFNLSVWTVAFPWDEAAAGSFDSSSSMLNAVYDLCKATVKYTSLDMFVDSNTRERLPYEADGAVTAATWRSVAGQGWDLPRLALIHNALNPTW